MRVFSETHNCTQKLTTQKQNKWWLMASCAAFTFVSTNAYAQENTSTDDIEEVTVTGNRLALQRAIDQKRQASVVKDSLGLDDLGKLPDKNIGESINRIPGISMLVEKGEGRFVQIRGISPNLNNVTINGMGLGSPEADAGGRRVPLDVVGGELMGGVEVIKTRTPDMDGQGIGGTLNLITKQPFDFKEDFWALGTVRAGFEQYSNDNDFGGHLPFGGDLTIGGKNQDGTFGWLVGASYSSREYVARGIFQDDWREVSGGTNTIAIPEEVKNNHYVIGRERLNLNAALEYRPDHSSQYYVRGFYAKFDEFQHRNRFQQELDNDVSSLTENSGISNGNRASANIRLENADKQIMTLTAGGENSFDGITIDYQVQVNRNELDEPYSYWEFRSGGSTFGPDAFAIDDKGVVTVTPGTGTADRLDPSNHDFRRVRFQERSMKEDGLQAQINMTWETNDYITLKTGAKYTETERTNDYQRERYDGAVDFTLAEQGFTNGSFINEVNNFNAPNIWMDVDAMNAFFAANPDHFELNEGSTFSDNFASDYTLTEKILAAYGMAKYETETLQVIAGVRVEKTEIDSIGYLRSDGAATEAAADNSYTDWLPSLIANFRPTDDIVIRAGITRSVGRPDYDSVALQSSYSEETGEGSLSVGNPNLEARTAWSYDLSLEWYFNRSSVISAALFYKDISNEIVGTSERITDTATMDAALATLGLAGDIDTADLTELVISQPTNASSSVLKGVEFALTTQFDFLPSPFNGFGITSSVSFIDGHNDHPTLGEIPLLDQTKRATSITLFYQNGNFDSSLSYNHNKSFLTNLDINDSTVNLNQGSFGRLDFKASYQINENLEIFFEASNLNNEPTTEFQGGNVLWNTEYEYIGRSFFGGISARF